MKEKKILFLGLGSIGQRHLRNLIKLEKKIKIYAIRKINKSPLLNSKNIVIKGSVTKKYKIKNLKSIDDNKFDIIFITNPSSFHIDTFLKLKGQRDAYVFIEKPLDVSLKKISSLNKLIKKNNINVFVGCNLRFTKPYKIIKKKIRSKSLGKINYVMIKSSLNITDYHSYEDYKKSYTSNKKLGGGINFTSIHEIDLILNLFDKTNIHFSLSKKISNLKINVNDFSTSVFKTSVKKNNFLTLLTMDHFQISKERYLKIIFEKGEILWDIIKNSIVITKKNSKKIIYNKNNHNEMYLDEIKYFLNFVKKKKKIDNSYNHINGIKCLKTSIKLNSNFKK